MSKELEQQMIKIVKPYADIAGKLHASVELLKEAENELLILVTKLIGFNEEQAKDLVKYVKESI